MATNKRAEMPKDVNSVSLQALGMRDDAQKFSLPSTGTPNDSGVISATEDMVVRVLATEAIFFTIHEADPASAAETILPAGAVEYFNIRSGQRFAFLRVALDGTVKITEMG